ncbi:MAG: GWxTD domain-containing protein [Candidatus Krumholzibacteria bacterium]|nr:GWxTD domain-containing protein [Candidatus Krumholzibacteria bacterium]
MSHKPLFVCAAAFLCIALSAPVFGQGDFNRPMETAFELAISQQFDENSKQAILVTVSVPYRKLVFFVRGERYESRYRVYVELKDAHGKRVRGEVWEESVATSNFRETTSAALMASSRKRFPIEPGNYKATVTIEVIDTSRRFTENKVVRVVGDKTGRLELASPVFYTHPDDSLAPKPRSGEIAASLCQAPVMDGERVNSGAIYGDFNAWARVVCNVAIPSAQRQAAFVVTARVWDARRIIVLYTRKVFDSNASGHAALCFDINIEDLPLGEYEIEFVAGTSDGAQESESEGRFTVLFNRGLFGGHIGDLVELLSIVADEKEARAVAEAPPAERMNAWASFWRKRDPTVSTESNEAFSDFLQRLKYVLANFSAHKPGWRTDMGKIYLKNGAPDNVEDRQEGSMGRYYRLWYYYSNGVVYVFEDALGTGDYHLLSTEII